MTIDDKILKVISEIKSECGYRHYEVSVFCGDPCDGCPFYTTKANRKKKHCQISALLGFMSANPLYWNIEQIEKIMGETE